ncbi:MAG: cob(I)yrinic acid a,c-diamide adenosyltransferase [Pseudomonadota bacterium]
MGSRLTKIYTRTGDRGETGLAGGKRVSKDSALVHAMGDVDELNSLLGLLTCKLEGEIVDDIKTIQNDLFDFGAQLNMSSAFIRQAHVDWLEQRLDLMNEGLPPLKEFILPGGGEVASVCHLARSVCRRAERSLVEAGPEQVINAELFAYVNRLSDLLFVMARFITKQEGEKEIYWKSDRLKN